MTPPPFHIPVRSLQEATHEQVAILLIPGHFRTKLFVPVSRRRWFSFAKNMAAPKFRLQRADYNGCESHLTGILPLFFLFKLFSMEIENFDKTRVKFLVEIKREIFRFNSLSGHDAKS